MEVTNIWPVQCTYVRCSKLSGIYLTCKYNKPRVVMRSGFSGENLWKWDQEWRTLIETNLNKDTRLIYPNTKTTQGIAVRLPSKSLHCPLFPYNKAVWVHASISMQNFNKFFSFIFFIMQKVLLFGCCVSSGNHFLLALSTIPFTQNASKQNLVNDGIWAPTNLCCLFLFLWLRSTNQLIKTKMIHKKT